MPTYVYKFTDTGETIEVYQAFTDDALTQAVHPATGKKMKVRKVFTPVGVTFKGGGFYKTDSRNGSSRKSGSNSSNGDSGTSESASSTSDGTTSGTSSSDTTSPSGSSSTSPTSAPSKDKPASTSPPAGGSSAKKKNGSSAS